MAAGLYIALVCRAGFFFRATFPGMPWLEEMSKCQLLEPDCFSKGCPSSAGLSAEWYCHRIGACARWIMEALSLIALCTVVLVL